MAIKNNSILTEKSYLFAIEIVQSVKLLQKRWKEFTLSKQLLKNGTAIGVLIREAKFAQSRADYINKFSIALKEANESLYWLSLLHDTFFLDDATYQKLYLPCDELICLLVSTIKTLKSSTPLAS